MLCSILIDLIQTLAGLVANFSESAASDLSDCLTDAVSEFIGCPAP